MEMGAHAMRGTMRSAECCKEMTMGRSTDRD